MTLIGLSGKRRVGKDTVAAYLEDRYGFTVMAFADPLKRACAAVFGFTHAQLYGAEKLVVDPFWGITPGWALQVVGTECFRGAFGQRWALATPNAAADVWVKAAERQIAARTSERVVFTDCRFPNEAHMIQRLGGKLIRVERPGLGEIADGRDSAHESETALDAWKPWDARIVNDSSLDVLYAKVDALMREWS